MFPPSTPGQHHPRRGVGSEHPHTPSGAPGGCPAWLIHLSGITASVLRFVSNSLHYFFLYLLAQLGIVFQQRFRGITALCQFLVAVTEP